jgi:WD40 repeat protein
VSAGGRWVAFGNAESLQVFALGESDRPQWRLSEGPKIGTEVQHILIFSPDGQAVLFANSAGALRRLDLTTGRVETLFEPRGRDLMSVACSPDGRRIAAGYGDQLIQWMDRISGERRDLPPAHADNVHALGFSSDGQLLASAGYDIGVQLWDLRSGSSRALLTGPLVGFYSVSFSPDGRRLAAGGTEGQVSVWDIELSAPLEVLNSSAAPDPTTKWAVNRVVFRADDTLVTENGHSVRLWPAPPLAEIDQARRAK